MSAKHSLRKVSSWADTYRGQSYVIDAATEMDCLEALDFATKNNLTIGMLGSGCSFGDSVVNNRNVILNLRPMNSILSWSVEDGVVVAEAGVSMRELLFRFMSEGFVPSSVPGTLNATIGGAIANNVHGKDSISVGNFGRQVIWIELLTADGVTHRISREHELDLFRATVGGLGLTGIILRAALKLKKIPSIIVDQTTTYTGSIEDTCHDLWTTKEADYAQVWLDGYPKGNGLGRGMNMSAKFIEDQDLSQSDLSQDDIGNSLKENNLLLGVIPSKAFWRCTRFCFYPPIMPWVNYAYWKKDQIFNRQKQSMRPTLFSKFYFFHNNIPNFYSVYCPPGFIEIQALLPTSGNHENFRLLLELARKKGITPTLSGMKRALPDDYYISFQGHGMSISFDIPIKPFGLPDLRKRVQPLFEKIVDLGGTVNLSKDQLMPREIFKEAYPRWKDFWRVKNVIDPNRLFQNDMARRIFNFE